MNTTALYDKVCMQASAKVVGGYSTSFSLGIRSLQRRLRDPIRAIYAFVRFADEIVDTFHGQDKADLLTRFANDTERAISEGISLNPVLHSFQLVVRSVAIERELIRAFLASMEMDLERKVHDRSSYATYVLGSAEVVGLMCLRVFCEGDDTLYLRLKPAAMHLGAAFQKINFLRDLKDDHQALGRSYFPGVRMDHMENPDKVRMEREIQADLDAALEGIRSLPRGARSGVYVAYTYYRALFRKIQLMPLERMLDERIRIPDGRKITLLTTSYLRHSFGQL